MASELSKTGLRMFLRPLDRFLEFHMAPIPFRKIRQNRDFYQNREGNVKPLTNYQFGGM